MKEVGEGVYNLEHPDELNDRMRPPKVGGGPVHVAPVSYGGVPKENWDGTFGPYCSRCKKCHKGDCVGGKQGELAYDCILICEYCHQPYDDQHIHDHCKLDPE